MSRRQTPPRQWLLVTDGNRSKVVAMARQLPRGSGILLLVPVTGSDMRRLRTIAVSRGLRLEREGRGRAARVHDLRQLRAALMQKTRLILLSPMFPTNTHPDWTPMPRMRAATLARLAGRDLVALGGMNERRYARVVRLGFSGWAGVSAFRT
jgi:thiamine-phosphate pyrophosphorylase